ncbi:histidine phosphatase family protein [Clostridium sp. 'deep sea']|uniref:histidine phosphatase family protein n=1 Tax=Clostridium sp. 'deep sea' TaxID=2779445 RepID=UPI0018969E93|nr:histidine phosphatase family protein [Clostridium sp. 'deep sea']QOR35508.1 histidine phosphatase family protein [Clostridium sp. 'deep sea']
MSRIYFVRHAESNSKIHEDLLRPLTEQGKQSAQKITEFFKDKNITKALSSPYKRSIDTIKPFTDKYSINIELIEDFRERKIATGWIADFTSFAQKQWSDFNYKLEQGECLREVQKRNINALTKVIKEYDNQNIIIGTHGTALCTILHYYNNDFCYNDFDRIRPLMPYVICLEFNDKNLVSIKEFLI